MRSKGHELPLFETERAKGRVTYRLFASSIFVGICLIWVYRLTHIPKPGQDDAARWAWIGLLASELWFGFYWILTQAVRWNRVHRITFKNRLSQRYENDELPGVDVFVCTADPTIEPPIMVINTVLSVMAYDFPAEKLSVYLSDDGGSDLTFYALLEASKFAKDWIPYCKEFDVEPRSPAAYFKSMTLLPPVREAEQGNKFIAIKKLYKDMENRIENTTKLGRIPEEEKSKHEGFSQWESYLSRRDHDTIFQIVIDGKDADAKDVFGCTLPTLVYLAREKRPHYHHNFKAGAMNALIRVSSKISNGEIILNVDCDMYSNNSKSIRDALCFLLDEEKGHDIAFVQFPQKFENNTKNDLYGTELRVINKMGLKYGCPVEDVITGLSIQTRGWKSVFFSPSRPAFMGVAPTTLLQTLVQHKRWSEGDFQILLSKYSPAWYAHNKITLGLQLGYCCYCLWAPTCLATLYYSFVPSLCLLKSIPLFPPISSLWLIPFAYVVIAKYTYSLAEFLWSGGTIFGWWNEQRMWLYKRASSYLFAFIDTILNSLGFSESAFVITTKVADKDVYKRYEKEIMEFGTSSPMFTILSVLAMVNLYCFVGAVKEAVMGEGVVKFYETVLVQILLCGVFILINLPLYQGIFLRKDKGKMPSSVAVKSAAFGFFFCTCFAFMY